MGVGASAFLRQLLRARRAYFSRALLEGVFAWMGLCLPGLAILLLLGFFLPPTRAASAAAAVSAGLLILGSLARRGLRPLLSRPDPAAYARWLEERAGLARNELVNALHLDHERARWDADPVSRALVDLSVQRGARRLGELQLRELHRRLPLLPQAARAAVAAAVVLGAAILAPVRFADSVRLFTAAGRAGIVPQIEIVVEPGDLRVERGKAVTIRAQVSGRRRPKRVDLEMRPAQGDWVRVPMAAAQAPGAPGVPGVPEAPAAPKASEAPQAPAAPLAPGAARAETYAFLVGALSGDLDYRIHTPWARSPVHHLQVIERLQATGYRKSYEPPAYTGAAVQRETAASGGLAALSGTRVTLEVLHRRPGATGRLIFGAGQAGRSGEESDARSLTARGEDALAASWTLERVGSYCVELRDAAAGEVWLSDTFQVEVFPDLAPAVRLLSPPEAITIPPDLRVTLEIDCVDDFGLTELALVYGRAVDNLTRQTLGSWSATREARVAWDWDLTAITLLPGQELHYYLQVLDNDLLHGPKSGETPLCTIRFPSLAEMYAQAEEDRHGDIAALEDAVRGQERLRNELEQVAREMLRDEEISWERQQEIQDLIARQEELATKVSALQQSMAASQQRMENQNLFSLEMIEQVREIQSLVAEIQSTEFHAQLERMQQALQQLDRQALAQAMQQMKLSQEEISQALDRTLQMLRRLLTAEKLDRIVQKMNELTARQAELNRQLEMGAVAPEERDAEAPEGEDAADSREGEDADERASADSLGAGERPLTPEESEALRAEQERVQRELEELQRELAELQKSAGQDLAELAKALEEFREQPQMNATLEQMRQAQQAMSQSARPQALKFGRKAQQGLEQMQAGLMSMKQELSVEEAEAIARSLYRIANRLVRVSEIQEGLAGTAAGLGPREMALREHELYEEVAALGDSLLRVAGRTPVITRGHLRSIGEVLRDIESARDQFESGRSQPAAVLVAETSRKLNAAVKTLLEAASQARGMCSSNCPNPFNQMQCLTGQQSALNQDTQQALGACQTPRLTLGQQEGLMRLAARQQMIQQGLQEIQGQLESSGKLMGDVGETAREMEEVARELRARNADPRLIERQERILSRLLSAQRSLRKQDDTEERQSRPGENVGLRVSPPGVDMGRSPAERLRRAMLRGSQDPVPPEYRRLVEAYMQMLLRSH